MAAVTASASFSLSKPVLRLPSSPLPSALRSSKSLNPPEERRRLVSAPAISCSSSSAKARFGSLQGGAGVLERPTFDQSRNDPFSQVEEGGDIGRLKHRRGPGSGDSYRVLLIDDVRHTEKLVVKVLPQAVPSVTPDDATKLFKQSRETGSAVVIVTVKEHAEFYSQMMVRGGLRSAIEPDSDTV